MELTKEVKEMSIIYNQELCDFLVKQELFYVAHGVDTGPIYACQVESLINGLAASLAFMTQGASVRLREELADTAIKRFGLVYRELLGRMDEPKTHPDSSLN